MKLNRKHQKKLKWIQKNLALGVPLASALTMGSTSRAEEPSTSTPSEIRKPLAGDVLIAPRTTQTDSTKDMPTQRKEKTRRIIEQRRIHVTAGIVPPPPLSDTPKQELKKK